jgi:exosortase A-associated hydrolase 1
MSSPDEAVIFPCANDTLFGVLSAPEAAASDMGVVVVVGGPQYRVGSHRQFVLLARALAARGFPCLRFDVRGMGDSTGAKRSFEALDEDVRAAVDALIAHCPNVRRVVLWGLCDGASAALMYAPRDPRVMGLVIVNPWVRSEETLARVHVKHYYARRLLQAEFWRKLGSGSFDLRGSLASLLENVRASFGMRDEDTGAAKPFQQRMAQGLRGFQGKVLLVTSGNDFTAQEFLEVAAADEHWRGLLTRPNLSHKTLPEADHTFSTRSWRGEVESATLGWLASW